MGFEKNNNIVIKIIKKVCEVICKKAIRTISINESIFLIIFCIKFSDFLFNIKLFKLPKMKEKIFESDADSPNRNCKIK